MERTYHVSCDLQDSRLCCYLKRAISRFPLLPSLKSSEQTERISRSFSIIACSYRERYETGRQFFQLLEFITLNLEGNV